MTEKELEAAFERAKVRHQAAIYNLQTSFQYRLGDALVKAVTSKAGAKQAPRALAGLAREAWQHRRGTADLPPPWPEPTRRDTQVATVLDEFSHTCFAPEFAISPVRPGEAITSKNALLFTETAWEGNGSLWSHAFSQPNSANAKRLEAVLASARAANVPTVLWNKEDPANYEVFIDTARKFDWVFTTDAALVDTYRQALGHDRVGPLLFAAQPAIHNPVGTTLNLSRRIAFFGAWRGDKYPARAQELTQLLSAAADHGALDIYDRNADRADKSLHFPAAWSANVRGSLPYTEVNAHYRQQAAVLNVNSAVDSPTMVARRVFEILASRTPVISSPADSLEPLFGDTVLVAHDKKSASSHVQAVLHNVDFRERLAHRGYRHVHSNHTYSSRVDQIFNLLEHPAQRAMPEEIDVICVSNRPDRFAEAVASYERQVNVDKRLIFVANSEGFDMETVTRRVESLGGQVLRVDDEATLGECLNEARLSLQGRYFAKFDDDDYYGPHHLQDLVLASRYAGAAVVGRRTYYVSVENDPDNVYLRNPGSEFRYVEFVCGGAFLAENEAVDTIAFEAVKRGTDTQFMRSVSASGQRIFSASKFNYLVRRRSDPRTHTWQIDNEDMLRKALVNKTSDHEGHVNV